MNLGTSESRYQSWFQQDGIPPSPRALNQPQTTIFWSPHEKQLSGALLGDFKFSPCPERNYKRLIYSPALHSAMVVSSIFHSYLLLTISSPEIRNCYCIKRFPCFYSFAYLLMGSDSNIKNALTIVYHVVQNSKVWRAQNIQIF